MQVDATLGKRQETDTEVKEGPVQAETLTSLAKEVSKSNLEADYPHEEV